MASLVQADGVEAESRIVCRFFMSVYFEGNVFLQWYWRRKCSEYWTFASVSCMPIPDSGSILFAAD